MEDVAKVKDRVGWRIAELRERAGMTQGQMAERIDVTASNYQRIEYGGQNLTIETMVKIANALRVPIADLFAPPDGPRKAKVGRPSSNKRRPPRS